MIYNCFQEVMEEDLEILNEVIKEDTEAILKKAKEIRDKAFNKEYEQVKKLEEEVI